MKALKNIAMMYIFSGVVFLVVLYTFSQFGGEDVRIKEMKYNEAFTLHGVIMVFLFILPAIPSLFSKKDK